MCWKVWIESEICVRYIYPWNWLIFDCFYNIRKQEKYWKVCTRNEFDEGVENKSSWKLRKLNVVQETVLTLLHKQLIKDFRVARNSSHFCWLMYISGGKVARSSSEKNSGSAKRKQQEVRERKKRLSPRFYCATIKMFNKFTIICCGTLFTFLATQLWRVVEANNLIWLPKQNL